MDAPEVRSSEPAQETVRFTLAELAEFVRVRKADAWREGYGSGYNDRHMENHTGRFEPDANPYERGQ